MVLLRNLPLPGAIRTVEKGDMERSAQSPPAMRYAHTLRSISLLLLLSFTGTAQPQDWCPPAAVWVYHYGGLWGVDYEAEHRYLGDTLIGGLTAHHIAVTNQGLGFGGQPFTSTTDEFTLADDGVVYMRNGSQWDTLYWFGAQVGDRWWPIGHPENCPPHGLLEVVATGDTIIQGITLLTISVVVIDENGNAMGAPWTIAERIGMTPRFPSINDCSIIIEYDTPTFLCYSDVDIQLPPGQPCRSTVGLHGPPAIRPTIGVHPNPGTTLRITGFQGCSARWRLMDAQGRTIREGIPVTEGIPVDVDDLNPGTYVVEVRLEDGRRHTLRWQKQ